MRSLFYIIMYCCFLQTTFIKFPQRKQKKLYNKGELLFAFSLFIFLWNENQPYTKNYNNKGLLPYEKKNKITREYANRLKSPIMSFLFLLVKQWKNKNKNVSFDMPPYQLARWKIFHFFLVYEDKAEWFWYKCNFYQVPIYCRLTKNF